jgi:hypothetical protein
MTEAHIWKEVFVELPFVAITLGTVYFFMKYISGKDRLHMEHMQVKNKDHETLVHLVVDKGAEKYDNLVQNLLDDKKATNDTLIGVVQGNADVIARVGEIIKENSMVIRESIETINELKEEFRKLETTVGKCAVHK